MINDEIVDDGNIDLVEQRLHVHAPFSLGDLPLQTRQQSPFVDAGRHRRVDRRHGRSQVLDRIFQHPRNMVPFAESLNRRPFFIVTGVTSNWIGY
jgi:hypothetical protein